MRAQAGLARHVALIAAVFAGSLGSLPGAAAAEPDATCPVDTRVSVASRNGAYPQGLDWSRVEKAIAFRSESLGVTSINVYLSNFYFSADSYAHLRKLKLGTGQAMVELLLVNQIDEARKVTFDEGVYDFTKPQHEAQRTGVAGIKVEKGTTVQFSYHYTEGEFVIVEVTENQVCGRFDLKDKFNEVSGEFSAPIR